MTIKPRHVPALAGLLLLTACHAARPGAVGSAHIGVSAQALSQGDIASVIVTIIPQWTSPTPPANIVQALTQTSEGWTGIIGEIPAGSEKFVVDAYDGNANLIYTGSALVTIVEGQTAAVIIELQQSNPSTAFTDTAPVIESVTASANAVAPGDTVNLTVTAQGTGTLSYLWSPTGGAIPPCNTTVTTNCATSTTVIWTAPSGVSNQTYQIAITVTDSQNVSATVSLSIAVDPTYGRGSAALTLSFNTWPVVSGITATPSLVAPNGQTSLSATVTVGTFNTLAYAWTDNCGGAFSASTATPTWTAPSTAPTTGTCTLSLTVTDGNGGSATGSLTLTIGTAATTDFAPVFVVTYQDLATATPGATVFFSANAQDPQGSALTLTWTTTACESLGTPTTTLETDGITYVSTDTLTVGTEAQFTVTVTATNAFGLQRSHVFTVQGSFLTLGTGSVGTANGQFNAPGALAVDAAGDLYVVDSGNDRIQKFDSSGTFLAAFGSSNLTTPTAIAVNSAGNVFVANQTGPVCQSNPSWIDMFSANGTYITDWEDNGGAGYVGFPSGLAFAPDGTLWEADTFFVGNGCGQGWLAHFNVSTFLWLSTNGPQDGVQYPTGVAVDPSGNVWYTDGSHVYELNPAFGGPQVPITLAGPVSGLQIATASNGDLWLANVAQHNIEEVTPAGAQVASFGSQGSAPGQLNTPAGIVAAGQYVWVSDSTNNNVQRFQVSCPAPQGCATGPTAGLVGCWLFDDNANDYSGNGYNGSVASGATLTTDKNGNANSAYSFTGAGGGLSQITMQASTLPQGAAARTLSAWYQTSSNTDQTLAVWGSLAGTDELFGILTQDTPQCLLSGWASPDQVLSSVSADDGNWHHVVFTYDGATMALWLDGTELGSQPVTLATTGTELFVGARQDGYPWAWDGSIDDVRVWNVALSAAQISALYSSGPQ